MGWQRWVSIETGGDRAQRQRLRQEALRGGPRVAGQQRLRCGGEALHQRLHRLIPAAAGQPRGAGGEGPGTGGRRPALVKRLPESKLGPEHRKDGSTDL